MIELEFYNVGTSKHFCCLDSSVVPPVGALVSIKGKAWKVIAVKYAVDHSDEVYQSRKLRACITAMPV